MCWNTDKQGMKGGKEEGKAMDPLFPRMHISDADKGGPRAPPRNKMALCEQYNVASQSSKFGPGSLPLFPLVPSSGSSSFHSQASSKNFLGDKGKKLSTPSSMPGSSHLTENYISHCRDGVTSSTVLVKSEPWLSLTDSYLSPFDSDNSKVKPKFSLAQPNSCLSFSDSNTQISGDENDFKASCLSQSGKGLNYGILPLPPGNGRGTSFCLVSSGEPLTLNSCLKLPKVMSSDQVSEHCRNPAEEKCKFAQDSESCSKKPCHISLTGMKNLSDTLAGSKLLELGIREHKNISMKDEQITLHDRCVQSHQECKTQPKLRIFTDFKSGMPETASRKRYASAMDDSSCSFPQSGDFELPKLNLSKESLEDIYSETLTIGNADKKPTEASAGYPDLNPEDVVSVIGHRLFWRARKLMVLQQKTVSTQLFDLHRLIKAQRDLAKHPEILHDRHLHPDKPSIPFPPINKLLYVNPLDPMPTVSKTKEDALKSDTDKDCGEEALSAMLPLPAGNTEKGLVVQQITPKPLLPMLPSIPTDAKLAPLPMPVSIPTDPKLATWCFHPPPGGQWLVPVRSPSEGLIYKSYPGPSFPTAGVVSPISGNCTVGGMAYGVPLGQNYLQPYGLPPINASALNVEGEQGTSSFRFQLPELEKNSSTGNANIGFSFETSHKILSEQSAALSDPESRNDRQGEGNSPGSPSERTGGETLSLFPASPSCHALHDQSKVQVIKVVPHSRNSAAESAARIFQSIQEERKRA